MRNLDWETVMQWWIKPDLVRYGDVTYVDTMHPRSIRTAQIQVTWVNIEYLKKKIEIDKLNINLLHLAWSKSWSRLICKKNKRNFLCKYIKLSFLSNNLEAICWAPKTLCIVHKTQIFCLGQYIYSPWVFNILRPAMEQVEIVIFQERG